MWVEVLDWQCISDSISKIMAERDYAGCAGGGCQANGAVANMHTLGVI